MSIRPRDSAEFPNWDFPTLDIEFDAESKSFWMYYKADTPPCYTLQTINDIVDVRESLRALFRDLGPKRFPVRYFVMASKRDGIFNLGGDLATFAESLRKNDRSAFRRYGHAAIDGLYGLLQGFDLPIVTLALIQGDALGGGLEAALAEDFLVAERRAKMGVPEVAFNTFPGMGAASTMTRRMGAAWAEEVMTSGKIFSAGDLHAQGLIDVLAENGEGRARLLKWIEGGEKRFSDLRAVAQNRRNTMPISYEELIAVNDEWGECCYMVEPTDVRHMERLVAAQKRKTGTAGRAQ
nr:crotonase/enoyl-CoA hydratase family protein [Aestuariivirga litoralis]